MGLETVSFPGLEIFQSGKWNGDVYTEADLDAMIQAFGRVGFQPVVKAGHADGQEDEKRARQVFGAPALGYVERIYRQGTKLLADIKDMPKRFAELIRKGAYKRVSSEIYWNYVDGGDKKWPRVLKAVAFLGADIPALTNLRAVKELYRGNKNVRVYQFALKERSGTNMETENFGQLLRQYNGVDMEAGRLIDAAVKQRQEKTGEDYRTALKALSGEARRVEAESLRSFSQEMTQASPEERYDSGIELDRIAKDFVLREGIGYSAALKKACLGNPTLAMKYTGKLVRGDGFARAYDATPDITLSSVVTGAPRLSNGRIDWATAVKAAAQYPDLCQKAASGKIEHLARQRVRNEGLPGNLDDHLPGAMAEIRQQHPALSGMADGRNVTEEALRDVFPQYN